LVEIPVKKSVNRILDDFYKEYLNHKPEDAMEHVVQGLKSYFENTLGNTLLYRFERQQYVEQMKKEIMVGDVYGVEHLMRLFVQLPSLIAHTNMDQDAINILKDHICTFLIYLEKHREELFVNNYEPASTEYLALQKIL
jgi:mortality factor 4-like protein 1